MKPDHASLKRQPLFTPIWLAAIGAFFGLIVLACATWVWATADSTLVVVIPDAEKQLDAGEDTLKAPAGEARAARLGELFGTTEDAGHIDAIYVPPTVPGRVTAPLAARPGLTPIVVAGDAPTALARRVLREHAGGRILIVAHDDTVKAIIGALGAGKALSPVAGQNDGTMYIVSVPRIGRANVLRIHH